MCCNSCLKVLLRLRLVDIRQAAGPERLSLCKLWVLKVFHRNVVVEVMEVIEVSTTKDTNKEIRRGVV